MGIASTIAKNTLFNFVTYASDVLINFAVGVILARFLGPDEYGLYSFPNIFDFAEPLGAIFAGWIAAPLYGLILGILFFSRTLDGFTGGNISVAQDDHVGLRRVSLKIFRENSTRPGTIDKTFS